MRFRNIFVASAATALLSSAGTIPASADALSDFYKNKHVSIVVAARAGGGHSNYSLFVSKF